MGTNTVFRDSVKIMAFYGRKAINNFPNPSQKINYFPNFLKKINNGNNGFLEKNGNFLKQFE